jgi:pyruvate dehydrogenase E1 component alpha subunit
MISIRLFEERIYNLFLTEVMPGTMHQCTGQEAVPTGVCAALRADDYITSTHRGHGHAIAKGVSLNALMAEMFARDTGCCRGMGGFMHMTDPGIGMLGATGIVGGGIPIASGTALSAKLRGAGESVMAALDGESPDKCY